MVGQYTPCVAPGILKRILLFLCASIFMGSGISWAAPQYPQRIISMSPSITETLFALGVGNRVVGVTDFCSYPKEACVLPKIGGLLNPSVEAWIRLKPDLIIHQDDSHKLKINAKNLGIKTLAISMNRLKNILETINIFGKVLGAKPAADALIQKLQAGIQNQNSRLKDVPKKSTLLLLNEGGDPNGALYAVGPGTFLGELLDLAGGKNVLTDPTINYPKISKEYILRHSPEVIIQAGPHANMTPQEKAEKLRQWGRFPTLTAVKNKTIYFVGADYILIPGPRFLNILNHFARVIHPEAFRD
jgi:ABC-type Fe3+-hydroxamate transport system substrate-binding protein